MTPEVSWQPSMWNDGLDDVTSYLERDVAPVRNSRYRRRKANRRAWQPDDLQDLEATTWRPRPAPTLPAVRLAAPSRIIFCDFDGVLNDNPRAGCGLMPSLVARLNALATELDAKVVVSSWWRCYGLAYSRRELAMAGFTGDVIGVTPWLGLTAAWDHRVRGVEVKAVVDALGPLVTGMVILDDHNHMADMTPWLVQTDGYTGLTDADVMEAAAILLEPTPTA